MTVWELLLVGIWPGWVVGAVGIWRSYRRALGLLKSNGNPAWMSIAVRQGDLDVLESVRWYLRFRNYIRSSALLVSSDPACRSLAAGAMRYVRVFELAGVAFLVVTAIYASLTLQLAHVAAK